MGFFPELALAVAGVIALLCPAWMLLGAAIIAGFAVPQVVFGSLTPTDLLLVVFVVRWVVRRYLDWTLTGVPHLPVFVGPNRWLLLFIAWAWAALLIVGSTETAPALARITLYALVFLAASNQPRLARPVLVVIALYASVEALLGLAGVSPRLDGRLIGLYGDPGVFGQLMLGGLAGSIALAKVARKTVGPLALVGAALTQTRGVWIAAALEVAVLLLPAIRRRVVRFAVIAAVCVGFGFWLQDTLTTRLGLNPQSLALRATTWEFARTLIELEPMFGHGWAFGLGNLPPGTQPAYNLWLNVAASTGILGAVLLTAFLVGLVRRLMTATNPLVRAHFAFVAAFLVVSFGEMTVYASSPVTVQFFVIGGTGLAVAIQDAHRRPKKETPGIPEDSGASEAANT